MFNRKQTLGAILIILLLLAIIGLIFVGSITQPEAEFSNGAKFSFLSSYLKYMFGGVILALFVYIIYGNSKTQNVLNNEYFLLGLCVLFAIFLLSPIFIGVSVNGAKRWIRFGSFTIQPSELVKPVLIYILANFMYENERKKDLKNFIIYWGVITICYVFFVLIQKSNTSALQLALICYLMLCVSSIAEIVKWCIAFTGLIGGGILILIKGGYALRRITQWANSDMPQIQVKAAIEAVKTGGILGRGIGNGYQKYFYLPEAHNDYIFASICEEGGLIFALLIIFLFTSLFIILFYIAISMENSVSRYIVYGVNFSITNQAILNILINLNIIPSTGITLPFISYGGSSFVANAVSIGLLFAAIKNYDNAKKGK